MDIYGYGWMGYTGGAYQSSAWSLAFWFGHDDEREKRREEKSEKL